MTTCRWTEHEGGSGYLLPDGEPCRTDDYGDPTTHCTARRTCSMHIGQDELTCARCVGRVRMDIRQIIQRAAELPPEAMDSGALSEAAMLAMPAADPRTWLERRLASIGHLDHWLTIGRINERKYVRARASIDDDEFHPYNVLTRWHMMLAEDYGIDLPATKLTTAGSAAFLDRIIGRVAQDEDQDFRLLRDEIRKCRAHIESVLHDSLAPERGAPCPTCGKAKVFVRLAREYAHYCDEPDCAQFHFLDETGDVWRCPRDREHWWTASGYVDEVLEERMGA